MFAFAKKKECWRRVHIFLGMEKKTGLLLNYRLCAHEEIIKSWNCWGVGWDHRMETGKETHLLPAFVLIYLFFVSHLNNEYSWTHNWSLLKSLKWDEFTQQYAFGGESAGAMWGKFTNEFPTAAHPRLPNTLWNLSEFSHENSSKIKRLHGV